MSWDKVRLGDVLLYEQPTKYLVETENYNENYKIPVLTAGKSFILGYTNEVNGVFSELPTIIFDDFTADFKFVDFPFKAKSSAMKMLTANKKLADIKFLYYLMQTLDVDTSQHKRHWISKFADLQIPLPPLPIQKRIAEILDAADALKRKDQELLKKYDELAQAIFIDMFGDIENNEKGWDKVKLSHFISKLETGVSVNSENSEFADNKACVLKTSCVFTGIFRPEEAKVIIPDEIYRAKLNPTANSIIISRMNTPELVGMSSYVDKDYSNLFLPDRLWMTVKAKVDHSVLWLSYALKSVAIRKQILKVASGTSGSMKNIAKPDFLNLDIINPPYDLQVKFELSLKHLNLLKTNTGHKKSEDLFKSLIQKAFKGELVS